MAVAEQLKKIIQGTKSQIKPKATTPTGEQRQDGILTQKADGTLTDYGKSLQRQSESQQIASNYKKPTEFDENRGMYGGLTPTYEAYVASAIGSGNQAASREAWQNMINSQNTIDKEKYRETSQTGYNPSAINTGTSTVNTSGNYNVTDNSAMINQSYESQKTAAVEALRNAIAKAKGTYQSTIKEAPTAFRPLKDQTTVAANQQLTRLRESMAEQGQAGGISRSEETAVASSRENQLNALNAQEQKVISDANAAIAQLESDGQFEEAKIVAENANNRIRALIEESNRVASEVYRREQTELDRRLQAQQIAREEQRYQEQKSFEEQRYQEQKSSEEKRYQESKTKEEQDRIRKDYASTINLREDQTAIINRLREQGVPDSDYRIIEHKKAAIAKLDARDEANALKQAQAIKDEKDRQEFAIEWAWKRFEAGLPADKLTSDLFSVPVGSVIPAQRAKDAELALQRQREARIASSAGKTSSGLTTNQAYTQARLILGSGASAQEVASLAAQLKSGNVNGTSASTNQISTPVVKTNTLKSQIDNNVKSAIDARFLTPSASVTKQLTADEIVKYSNNNQITDKQAMELIATYGLSQADIEQAERRNELVRGLGGR